jgi:hypothetical protein
LAWLVGCGVAAVAAGAGVAAADTGGLIEGACGAKRLVAGSLSSLAATSVVPAFGIGGWGVAAAATA